MDLDLLDPADGFLYAHVAMRCRNSLLIVPILFGEGCSGATSTHSNTTTGGVANTGGTTSNVGLTASGGLATGGSVGSTSSPTGGDTSSGGSNATGGTTSATVDSGSGCTGSLESIQNTSGRCVAKMVTITGPEIDAGITDYDIDVTEVTKGQYEAWLARNPALPSAKDMNCAYVTSYAQQGAGYTGNDADHHPVVYVDWCDASSYCKGVGKRLCGAIAGAANPTESYADASQSQWYRACSSGGANTYPYGDSYQATVCDGYDYSSTRQTVAVGSLPNCVTSATGYAGVYDLSGNVWEWEDSCSSTGETGTCHTRGGSYDYSPGGSDLTCDTGSFPSPRTTAAGSIGFRCCSQYHCGCAPTDLPCNMRCAAGA